MIYVIEKEEKIYISEEPRDKLEIEAQVSKLLFTLSWDLERLKKHLRPWINLGDKRESYKKSCLTWLNENYKNPELQDTYLEKMSMSKYEEENQGARDLYEYGILGKTVVVCNQKDWIYVCDMWNSIETTWGLKISELLQAYVNLGKDEKDALRKIYTEPGRDKKLDYILGLGENVVSGIYEFLPGDLRSQVLYSGIGKRRTMMPEWDRTDKLGGDVVDNPWKYIEIEIYETFKTGEKYEGQEIKEKLGEIYTRYGVDPGKVKIQDLGKYFDMSFFSYMGKGRYNLIKRIR